MLRRFFNPIFLYGVALFGLIVLGGAAAARADAPLPLELNKLEPLTQGEAGCRVYFVVTNPDAETVGQLRLDLILFGTDGVILRRIALDLGPLAAKKTGVRLFDLQGLACDSIGRVLINDVLACHAGDKPGGNADQERAACLDRLTLSSRTKVPLAK
ncbi:MAG: Tat pathway signal protein [Acidibrevibacterium sp.]|uniref:Tat pathway signal protein n=1 Tax=Acidibrevibacterium sp. TaxID=2606776 RepID=UPI003D003F09